MIDIPSGNKDFFDKKYVEFLKYLEKEFDLNSNQAIILSLTILEVIPTLIDENQILKELFARNANYIKQQDEVNDIFPPQFPPDDTDWLPVETTSNWR